METAGIGWRERHSWEVENDQMEAEASRSFFRTGM